jgi:hypothetical protein
MSRIVMIVVAPASCSGHPRVGAFGRRTVEQAEALREHERRSGRDHEPGPNRDDENADCEERLSNLFDYTVADEQHAERRDGQYDPGLE